MILRRFFGELEECGVLVELLDWGGFEVGGSCVRCCCWVDESRTTIIVRGHCAILAVIVAIVHKAIMMPVWCRYCCCLMLLLLVVLFVVCDAVFGLQVTEEVRSRWVRDLEQPYVGNDITLTWLNFEISNDVIVLIIV